MSRDFNSPKVMLTQLREYVSRNGNTYFSGYMGRTKLVLLRDTSAECTGAEVARWNLLIEEAPPSDERRPTNDAPSRAPLLEHHSGPVDNSPARLLPPRKTGASASDRRAADLLHQRGIDPEAPITDDALPL